MRVRTLPAAATTGRHTCACSTRSTQVIATDLQRPSCPAPCRASTSSFCEDVDGRNELGHNKESSNMAFTNRMQERLARGEVALCMATRLARTAEIAMIVDSCGFDAFYVDMEQCTISLDDAAQI